MSKSTAAARLQKELMDLMMSGTPGISAFPDNDNLFSWLGTIRGADNTAYEGIDYRIAIRFPNQYPFEPPTIHFITPCYHPNVDLIHGAICLDILKENWSAVYTAGQVMLSLQSLLDNPNNASPLNIDAAKMWENKVEFKRLVREHAKVANKDAASSSSKNGTTSNASGNTAGVDSTGNSNTSSNNNNNSSVSAN